MIWRPSEDDVATDDARDVFAHGLIESLHRDRGDALNARVAAALEVARAPPPLRVERPIWRRIQAVAAAAAVIAVIGFWFGGPGAPPARATYERVLRACAMPRDRRYTVSADRGVLFLEPFAADVFVRGGERVALHVTSGLAAGAWLGLDGRDAWMVPPRESAPVESADGDSGFAALVDAVRLPATRDLPWFSVNRTMSRLGDRYRLEFEPAERSGVTRVRGVLVDAAAAPLTPREVRFDARDESGELLMLELRFATDARAPLPSTLRFELTDEDERDDAFYSHGAHHAPGRAVVRR